MKARVTSRRLTSSITRRGIRHVISSLLLILLTTPNLWAQADSYADHLSHLQETMSRAGDAYLDERYEETAQQIAESKRVLSALKQYNRNARVQKAIDYYQVRIENATSALAKQNVSMPPAKPHTSPTPVRNFGELAGSSVSITLTSGETIPLATVIEARTVAEGTDFSILVVDTDAGRRVLRREDVEAIAAAKPNKIPANGVRDTTPAEDDRQKEVQAKQRLAPPPLVPFPADGSKSLVERLIHDRAVMPPALAARIVSIRESLGELRPGKLPVTLMNASPTNLSIRQIMDRHPGGIREPYSFRSGLQTIDCERYQIGGISFPFRSEKYAPGDIIVDVNDKTTMNALNEAAEKAR